MKQYSQKRLRIVLGLLIIMEILCFGVAVTGNQPIGTHIRRRLLELSKNPTSENKALLQEEMAKADEPYRKIRIGAWIVMVLNSVALLAAIRASRK
jgi:hypothetical protein